MKECVIDKEIPLGGTTPIGDPRSLFYVAVLGHKADNTANLTSLIDTALLSSNAVRTRALPPGNSLPLNNGRLPDASQLNTTGLFDDYPVVSLVRAIYTSLIA